MVVWVPFFSPAINHYTKLWGYLITPGKTGRKVFSFQSTPCHHFTTSWHIQFFLIKPWNCSTWIFWHCFWKIIRVQQQGDGRHSRPVNDTCSGQHCNESTWQWVFQWYNYSGIHYRQVMILFNDTLVCLLSCPCVNVYSLIVVCSSLSLSLTFSFGQSNVKLENYKTDKTESLEISQTAAERKKNRENYTSIRRAINWIWVLPMFMPQNPPTTPPLLSISQLHYSLWWFDLHEPFDKTVCHAE